MLTVKFIRYEKQTPNGHPVATESYWIKECNGVHVRYEPGLRTVVQCGDAPGETFEVTVGPGEDCSFAGAYVMNENGQTVDTIR